MLISILEQMYNFVINIYIYIYIAGIYIDDCDLLDSYRVSSRENNGSRKNDVRGIRPPHILPHILPI